MRWSLRIAALVAAGLWMATAVFAHPMAPSLLEVREDGEHVRMLWKISRLNIPAAELEPMLPASCRTLGPGWDDAPAVELQESAMIQRWTATCDGESLTGARITVEGLARTDLSVLLRVVQADGQIARGILQPDSPSFVVPSRPTSLAVAGSYLELGFEHILGGFDHLLFVLGLLFLIQGRRKLLLTVTAFTLGHSVTLALASLELVRLPSGPVELAIAASIWFIAWELAHEKGPRSSWAGRRPWWIAGSFGLLHGFGFAGALTEAGLPSGDIPMALLAFNVGIEVGQLAFIALVLTLHWGLSRLLVERREPIWLSRRLRVAASYVIGVLATYWCLERCGGLFPFI